MDVSPYLDVRPAPRWVFDLLPERRSRPRFMLPTSDGDWRALTWWAFAKQIREVALFLTACGLRHGDRAAVFAPNRVEWASSALAIQAAGGAMVPVYPASTPEQASYVVSHGDVRVLFVDTPAVATRVFEAWGAMEGVEKIITLDDNLDLARVLSEARAKGRSVPTEEEVARKTVTWSEARAMGASRDKEDGKAFERVLHSIDLHQPAVMLYTSGTSGNPKGVPLTHHNVGVNSRDWLSVLAPLLPERGTDVLWLPMSHIYGWGEMCLGTALGFTTYCLDPQTVLARLPEVRPDVFMSVPAYWDKLASTAMREPTPEARRAKLMEVTGGRLQFCLSGGAGLKREIKDFFKECGILIIEGYGLTETAPTLTMNQPESYRFDSVGKPFPSVSLMLAEDGEILAKGPNVFRGYHKDPEATKNAFTEDGWFKTGDVGRWTEDGFLQIIDRKKDILVTAGGKNVPPANIELRFADDPLFAHVVVYGEAKKFLVAGVWLNDAEVASQFGADPSPERDAAMRARVQKAIDAVNAQLASYETIKKFAIMTTPLTVQAGLLTASLKMRRKKVYEAFRDQFEALYDDEKRP